MNLFIYYALKFTHLRKKTENMISNNHEFEIKIKNSELCIMYCYTNLNLVQQNLFKMIYLEKAKIDKRVKHN